MKFSALLAVHHHPRSRYVLGWASFADCTSLVSFTIPDGITTILAFTFDECGCGGFDAEVSAEV